MRMLKVAPLRRCGQKGNRIAVTHPSLRLRPTVSDDEMRVLAACVLFAGAAFAVDVYLYPSPALSFASGSAPSPEQASLAISQYFGLEFADVLDEGSNSFLVEVGEDKGFVSQGQEDGLLLTIDEEDAQGAFLSSGLGEVGEADRGLHFRCHPAVSKALVPAHSTSHGFLGLDGQHVSSSRSTGIH